MALVSSWLTVEIASLEFVGMMFERCRCGRRVDILLTNFFIFFVAHLSI